MKNLLSREFDKHSYLADRVYNVDETSLSIIQSKIPRVISDERVKAVIASR